MFRRAIAVVVAAALLVSGCASAGYERWQGEVVPTPPIDRAVLVEYVRKLPIGSRVRVEQTAGGTIHGTLLAASTERLVVQRGTRIPEPPLEIPLDRVTRVTLETSRASAAKYIAIGAGAGAAAAFTVLMVMVAMLED